CSDLNDRLWDSSKLLYPPPSSDDSFHEPVSIGVAVLASVHVIASLVTSLAKNRQKPKRPAHLVIKYRAKGGVETSLELEIPEGNLSPVAVKELASMFANTLKID